MKPAPRDSGKIALAMHAINLPIRSRTIDLQIPTNLEFGTGHSGRGFYSRDAVESLQGGILGVLCRNARSQTPKGQKNFHARTYGKINNKGLKYIGEKLSDRRPWTGRALKNTVLYKVQIRVPPVPATLHTT